MQLRKTLLVGLVSATLLSGCSLFNSEEDVVTMSLLPKVENQFSPNQVWSASVGNGIGEYYSHLRPAAQANVVYAADRHGLVKALDLDSGKEIWQTNLAKSQSLFSSTPSEMLSAGVTVEGSMIFIGSEKAELFALNKDDGKMAWQSTAAGEILSRPVVSDGLVLVHTSNGVLQAFDVATGAEKWIVNLDVPSLSLRGESAPAIAYGAAIVGGDNGRVSAIMLKNGQMIWQQRISQAVGSTEIDRLSDVDSTPVVVGNVVYAIAYNGDLVALDLSSGQVIWKRDIGSINNFVVDAGRIYLVDQNDRVMGLSTDGGVVLWRQSELLHRNLTAPVLFNGYLVAADSEGYLHWMNTTDGRFVAQQKLDSSGFIGSPIVADGKLIIQARDGKVYALTR